MMNFDILSLDGTKTGSIELPADLFGRAIRKDLLARAVNYQLAAQRAGTAHTKTRGEINRTKKKMYRQKGTGGARHGARTPSLFVGGGVTFGPRGRDFSHSLTKSTRQAALKTAFSSKVASADLIIIDEAVLKTHKTAELAAKLLKLGATRATFIVDAMDANFDKATRNLPHIKVLPTEGANVYDILHAPKLVITVNAVRMLEARLATSRSKAAADESSDKPVKAKADKAPAKKAAPKAKKEA